jgi:hypothetical protein
MEKLVNGREYHIWFESFEEMEAEMPKMAERRPENRTTLLQAIACRRTEMDGRRWWGHSDGHVGMLKRIREGWPEYAQVVHDCAKRLEAHLELSTVRAMTMDVRRRKRARRESGDMLHMTRVWNGDLEHAWDRPERTPRHAPTQRYATVYVDLAASANRNANDGIWRAVAAAKINDLFTSAGVATEVWVGSSSSGAYPNAVAQMCWTGVRVKQFTQPLNEDRVAALTSVGALRTVGFMLKAAAPYTISSGFGMPLNRGLPLPLRERHDRGERVIRIGECWSLDDARREVAAVAAALANKEVTEDA